MAKNRNNPFDLSAPRISLKAGDVGLQLSFPDYFIRSVRIFVFLADSPPGAALSFDSVVAATGLPAKSVRILLRRAVAAGIAMSLRGPTGGYSLARPAKSISLADVLDAVKKGRNAPEGCRLRPGRRCDNGSCSICRDARSWERATLGSLKRVSLSRWAAFAHQR